MKRTAFVLLLVLVPGLAIGQSVRINDDSIQISGKNVVVDTVTDGLQGQINFIVASVIAPLQAQVTSLQSDLSATQVSMVQLSNALASAQADISALEAEAVVLHARIDGVDGIEGLPARTKVVNNKIWMRSEFHVASDACFDSLGPSGGTGVDESTCLNP